MGNAIDMGVELAASAMRVGWFYGVNRLIGARTRSSGEGSGYRAQRPVPARQELMAALAQLMMEDAAAVRDGVFPAAERDPSRLVPHLGRVRAMLADLPAVLARRDAAAADSVASEAEAAGVPDYYAQDFHFQTGGYLSPESARLYDVQVETLFYGAANAMRRTALRPVAEAIRGRDQRQLALLDVACGTGRFLRQARLAFPALRLTGLDLSQAYLDEAARHLGALRPARLIAGNAEAIQLPDASQDIVVTIFLYHELPGEVRRRVTAEIARVLKPGGILVFIDSLQMGDRPGWDGMLEAFPVRFHEPYFRQYVIEDLGAMFDAAGLVAQSETLAFLSKVMVRRKG